MKEDPIFQHLILETNNCSYRALEIAINRKCAEEGYRCVQIIDKNVALLEKVVYVPREDHPDLPF